MLNKALRRLEPYPVLFESVEVSSLREEVEAWVKALEAPSLGTRPPYPQIRVADLSR